jgi:ATP-dependent Clp protease ATP-binding subunit ClpA
MWFLKLPIVEKISIPVPLTPDAEKAFVAAAWIAHREREISISVRDLLLGLLESGPNRAATALEKLGITAEHVRRECDIQPRPVQESDPDDPFLAEGINRIMEVSRQVSQEFQNRRKNDPPVDPKERLEFLGLTPLAENALNTAWWEASNRGESAANPFDLLLAIFREAPNFASGILTEFVKKTFGSNQSEEEGDK